MISKASILFLLVVAGFVVMYNNVEAYEDADELQDLSLLDQTMDETIPVPILLLKSK